MVTNYEAVCVCIWSSRNRRHLALIAPVCAMFLFFMAGCRCESAAVVFSSHCWMCDCNVMIMRPASRKSSWTWGLRLEVEVCPAERQLWYCSTACALRIMGMERNEYTSPVVSYSPDSKEPRLGRFGCSRCNQPQNCCTFCIEWWCYQKNRGTKLLGQWCSQWKRKLQHENR